IVQHNLRYCSLVVDLPNLIPEENPSLQGETDHSLEVAVQSRPAEGDPDHRSGLARSHGAALEAVIGEEGIEAEMVGKKARGGMTENAIAKGAREVEKGVRESSDEESRRDKRARRDKNEEKVVEEEKPAEAEKPKKEPVDLLRTRTGGAYIPPAKLRMMQDQIKDKESEQYQRMNWERLKKKIHGLVNKVNTGNLVQVVRSLLQENVIRGKGLLVRSIMQAQAFSPVFSHVYAAFVAVINSKFPHIGELLLRRLIVQFKRSFRRNDKGTTVTVSKFIAHLINQRVAHEVLALEIMILMMETPTDDSVEVSIAFIKECGAKLLEVSPRALDTIFTRLRAIVQDGDSMNLDKRVQYMIEVVLTIRKDKFKAYPAVLDELDLIDEEDQITHTISLEDAVNPENELNVFKLDPEFEKNEKQYEEIRAEIIGDDDDSDDEESADDGIGSDDDADGQPGAPASAAGTTEIIDNTEQNLVAFR
ncbi:Pre-mRNA-splicing factor CWC22, partial [Trichostrongylus colubriformis]